MLPVQDGKRLGRGKGYYDSYLQQIKDKGMTTKTIGELFTVCAYTGSSRLCLGWFIVPPAGCSLCLRLVHVCICPALAFLDQMCEDIPTTELDVRVDMVLHPETA